MMLIRHLSSHNCFYLLCSSIAFLSLLQTSPTLASSDHNQYSSHNNNQKQQAWQLDMDLVYRQQSHVNVLGFLPTNQHEKTAGLKLEHLDLSYQSNISELIPANNLNTNNPNTNNSNTNKTTAKLTLSYHSNNFEVTDAWLKNYWLNESLTVKAGKYLPTIGFLNHSHHQVVQQTPLINRVYWGDELSEAGVELAHQFKSSNYQFEQKLNLLGGSHLNSKKQTIALLYHIQGSFKLADLTITALANHYQTQVKDRGLNLFDLTSTTHTHSNSQFSEYFDGDISHQTLGLKLSYATSLGNFEYQGEYAQRSEKGQLANSTTALAKLDLQSNGNYQQITWQSPAKKLTTGIRHNYIYSDVIVSETSDNSLDNSRLNNQQQTPQTLTAMLGYQFSQQQKQTQKLQIIYSKGIDWSEYKPQFELHYQQSFGF